MGSVQVYGKAGCGLCKAAAEKFTLLGIPNERLEISQFLKLHDGWKTDGSIEVCSAYYAMDQRLPIIKMAGEFYDYPKAMRRVKELKRGAKA